MPAQRARAVRGEKDIHVNVGCRANENAAPGAAFRERREAILAVGQHPVDGGMYLLVGQGRIAALRGHDAAVRAGEAFDGVLVQRVHALGGARAHAGGIQHGGLAHTVGVAGAAKVLVDLAAVQGAAVGDLGRSSGGGGGRGGGLRRRTGFAGIDRAGGGDARLGDLGGLGVHFRRQAVVQEVRADDQARGNQHQEADHHREMLEEFEVVVTHFPPLAARPRGRAWLRNGGRRMAQGAILAGPGAGTPRARRHYKQ